MGALLESGMVGNIGLKHLKVIKEDTINKWDKLGFLDGLKGHGRENIAQLYENQATHLINEATSAGAAGSFETVVFPIIRRVFSKLLANDIVSVQAMNLPIGKLFYFVPKVSSRSNTGASLTEGGSHYPPVGAPGTATGGAFAGADNFSATTIDLYDNYYVTNAPLVPEDGLYDISKGKRSGVTAQNLKIQKWNTSARTLSDATISDTVTDTEISSLTSTTACRRSAILKIEGFNNSGNGKLIGPSGNEMDSEEFLTSLTVWTSADTTCKSGSTYYDATNGTVRTPGKAAANGAQMTGIGLAPLLFRIVTQKYGKGIANNGPTMTSSVNTPGGKYPDICDVTGAVYVEVDLSCPACIKCDSVDGYVCSYFAAAAFGTGALAVDNGVTPFLASWYSYYDLEFEDQMGEVSFDLESVTVSVTERKLRAQWSPELAQDVSAFHNIDAEAELTALLSEEVAAEIDREILRDLRKGAAWDLRWDYNGWKRFQSGQAPYTQKDWNQTLITAINQISAQIHKSTLRGGANWIVVSSEVSAIFDDLEYFHVSNAAPDQDQYNMGIEKVGTLSGRYTIYRDPYFPPNQVLIGHKGTSLLDTGYVYAPYVPLQLTPTMYNPFNFTPIKGIMTRYAKKMVNNRFYGRITVDGVKTFDIRELR